ncbi:MAG: hypothetical protein JJE15_03320 [Desulfobacteraceae bacterium]|nr:hypothetical protein [Desulfobacteraceae bacterium]
MIECEHQWEMRNIQFGFMVFERCSHCNELRTYFSTKDIEDSYREGDCHWTVVENAQSFMFDLQCNKCGHLEELKELMGFLYCSGCLPDCKVDILQRQPGMERTMILVAFGFLPIEKEKSIQPYKLEILSDYFNQRRDTSRSKVKIVSFDLIKDFGLCKGEFIHDVGMLSPEPQKERKPLF